MAGHPPSGGERSEQPEALRDLAYYEGIPYLLIVESVERCGEWLRRAEYPELPGCAVEAASVTEAIGKLDQERLRLLRELWHGGLPIPTPRPPLRGA